MLRWYRNINSGYPLGYHHKDEYQMKEFHFKYDSDHTNCMDDPSVTTRFCELL